MSDRLSLQAVRATLITDEIKLGKGVVLCHLKETPPELNPDWVGCYNYRDGKARDQDQPFILLVGDQPARKRQFVEIDALIRLGRRVEALNEEVERQVLYVRLPKSHGFSGLKFGFRRTADLFPQKGKGPLNFANTPVAA